MADKNQSRTLKEVFDKGLALHKTIENDVEPSTSENFQMNVQAAIDEFSKATEMVNCLELFSLNEEIEEVPTAELRYLLLPAFLGDLNLKKMSDDRLTLVNNAQIYFLDFLKRLQDYGLANKDACRLIKTGSVASSEDFSGKQNFEQLAESRQAKIKRYKKQKEQESRLKELENVLSCSRADEEVQREHSVLLLKMWLNKAVEYLASIQDEMKILEHMNKMKRVDPEIYNKKNRPLRKPIKPILITRESLKAQVFGAGYSSTPTVTQEEYLEKEIREGKIVLDFDEHGKKLNEVDEKTPHEDCESLDDDDKEDLDTLQKNRQWDEWKDDHRRGWGNRENMG